MAATFSYICSLKEIAVMRALLLLFAILTFAGCAEPEVETTPDTNDSIPTAGGEVNVYTHRHYEVDKQLFAEFTEQTGIEVNVLKAGADELMVRIENEGERSPCDLLVTVDAARLVKAKEKGILQPISSEELDTNIPANMRDADGYWYAQTLRGRILVYSKDRVQPKELTTYEDLVQPEWQGRLLVRSSSNIYNQSLMASIIEHNGPEAAEAWAKGIVGNLAQDPKGKDRDQVKFIASGIGDVALVNTYYLGKMLNSEDPAEVEAAEAVGIFFPNQEGRGAHVNISGAGVAVNSPNKENAILLLEFLSQPDAQMRFAEANYEYPVHPNVAPSDLLKSWGPFKADEISLEQLGKRNAEAVATFDAAGWQ